MVTAVHYFATRADQSELLDYLGEPSRVSLHPWPVVDSPPIALTRDAALATQQVMIAHAELGPASVLRLGDAAMIESSKAGVFNRINWTRLRPGHREGLVDSNASPVLFWTPSLSTDAVLRVGLIGSQADSMSAVSGDYERWVNRVMGWVRRKGEKVWGLEGNAVRPDLDIQLGFMNNTYALPGALAALEGGTPGRDRTH